MENAGKGEERTANPVPMGAAQASTCRTPRGRNGQDQRRCRASLSLFLSGAEGPVTGDWNSGSCRGVSLYAPTCSCRFSFSALSACSAVRSLTSWRPFDPSADGLMASPESQALRPPKARLQRTKDNGQLTTPARLAVGVASSYAESCQLPLTQIPSNKR